MERCCSGEGSWNRRKHQVTMGWWIMLDWGYHPVQLPECPMILFGWDCRIACIFIYKYVCLYIYIYVHTNIHIYIYICVCVCLVPCVFKDSLKQNHHGAFNDDLMLLTLWHFAAFFPENLPGMVNGWWMNPCKFQHRHTVAHSSIPRATSCETEVLDVLRFFQGPWKVGPVGQISWNETQDLPFFF